MKLKIRAKLVNIKSGAGVQQPFVVNCKRPGGKFVASASPMSVNRCPKTTYTVCHTGR